MVDLTHLTAPDQGGRDRPPGQLLLTDVNGALQQGVEFSLCLTTIRPVWRTVLIEHFWVSSVAISQPDPTQVTPRDA